MKRLLGGIFLLIVTITFSGCNTPTPVPGISGSVYESQPEGGTTMPRPINGANLTLVRQSNNHRYYVQSGTTGEYIASVPDDRYTILVSHPDYEDFRSMQNQYTLAQSLSLDFHLRRMVGEPAPDSTWTVAWRDGAAVTTGETTSLGGYHGKVVMVYLSNLKPGICTCIYELAGALSDAWTNYYSTLGTVSFLYVALKPDDINVLQTYIPQLGYSEHRNLSDLSYPILFREKNNEDEYDTEMDDWRKYIGKYNYDPVGSSRGFHRDGMGIAIIDQTGTLYATYSYSEPGVDIGPVPCDDELRWTKTKLDELLNSKATLFSLWTDGPERISLQAIFDHFNGQYIEPLLDAQWIGRQNYPDVLTTLTASGESPTIFQRNLGPSQFDAMAENLDEVFSRNGLSTAFPHDLVEILSPDGHPYSVPVNIHRAGQLWYNKSVMQRMGINPANLETYTQWIEISRKFHDTGIVSLALQKDDMLPLFEVLLIDVLGKDKYRRLLAGEISWEGPEMQEAFPQVLQRIQEMEPFITLGDDPVDMVSKGMAATTLGTDEMASRFAERNFTDYGWMSPPGNGQIFIAYADSFSQWKESTPNPTARNFLNLIASKEGQELFNQTSGSICARMDCAGSNYGPYQQAAAADWKTHTIFPSLVFGGFVSPQQLSSIVQMIHELFQ